MVRAVQSIAYPAHSLSLNSNWPRARYLRQRVALVRVGVQKALDHIARVAREERRHHVLACERPQKGESEERARGFDTDGYRSAESWVNEHRGKHVLCAVKRRGRNLR